MHILSFVFRAYLHLADLRRNKKFLNSITQLFVRDMSCQLRFVNKLYKLIVVKSIIKI